MLLEKPAEIMLQHPEVDMPFCFSWANHTWSRVWADKTNNILKLQKYGDEKIGNVILITYYLSSKINAILKKMADQ